MSELKKITRSVPSGGMERPDSPGGNSGHIIRTPPKPEMERPVSPRTIVAEGTIDGFGKWALYSRGMLVVDGIGKMPNWSRDFNGSIYNLGCTTPWYRKEEDIKKIRIPISVTSIGDFAFCGCTNLISIYIPNSVTCIGEEAFSFCNNLTSIRIPDGVTSIGVGAFRECTNLTSIHIPDSVKRIESRAFYDCSSLTRIYIPDSVTYLGSGVFSACVNLRQVIMPSHFDDRLLFKWHYGIPKSIVTFV